ncbi:hypothetical protein EDD86DRAFT_243395, partial [Gorgonomyces haynaldii]
MSVDELKASLERNLQARGVFNKLEAYLRSEIFNALDTNDTKPNPNLETLLLNEIVREYLKFNGYKHALSVFEKEADLDQVFDRQDLQEQLNLKMYPSNVPLLYGLAFK